MAYRDPKQAFRSLNAVAEQQGGYFTAKQARTAGYRYPHLAYHIAAGNFERVGHGLYRLPTLPPSEHDDLVRLSLWSRGRDDRSQAVVSHESSLALYDLSDVIPRKVHLTVPPHFRKRPLKGCALHKAALEPSDIEERSSFRVTSPLRTLLDVAASTSVSQDQLDRAVREALDRGLVRKTKLVEAVRKGPRASRLSSALRAAR